MLFTATVFKTILVREMEPNCIRNVPELKNNLQVGGIITAKNFGILTSVEAHELLLAIEIWDKQGDQMSISAKLVTESETIRDPYSLKSDWTWPRPIVPV